MFNATNSSTHMPWQHLTFPLWDSALDTRREICISHSLPRFILRFRFVTIIWSTWSPWVYDWTRLRLRQRVWSKKLRLLERQEFKPPFHDVHHITAVRNSKGNALLQAARTLQRCTFCAWPRPLCRSWSNKGDTFAISWDTAGCCHSSDAPSSLALSWRSALATS
jgi:hypothetical protein